MDWRNHTEVIKSEVKDTLVGATSTVLDWLKDEELIKEVVIKLVGSAASIASGPIVGVVGNGMTLAIQKINNANTRKKIFKEAKEKAKEEFPKKEEEFEKLKQKDLPDNFLHFRDEEEFCEENKELREKLGEEACKGFYRILQEKFTRFAHKSEEFWKEFITQILQDQSKEIIEIRKELEKIGKKQEEFWKEFFDNYFKELIQRISREIHKEIRKQIIKLSTPTKPPNMLDPLLTKMREHGYIDRVSAIDEIQYFAEYNPVLIYGMPGVGKSFILARLAELHNGIYVDVEKKDLLKIYRYLNYYTREKLGLEIQRAQDYDDASNMFYTALQQAEDDIWILIDNIDRNKDFANDFQTSIVSIHLKLILASRSKKANISSGTKSYMIKKFSKEEVRLYIERHKLDADLDKLYEASEGNPLYLYYFSRLQIDPLPDGLEEYQQRILDQMSSIQKRILRLVALSRFPLKITQIAKITKKDIEYIENEIKNKIDWLFIKHQDGYTIFHHKFEDGIIYDIGDEDILSDMHKDLGEYYESIIESHEMNGRLGGMHHYRMCNDKKAFMRCFDEHCLNNMRNKGLWDDVEANYEYAISIERKPEWLVELGIIKCLKSKWDDAISFYNEAKELFESAKDEQNKRGLARCMCYLGVAYYKKGEYKRAVELHKKSLEIFIELEDKQGIAQTYNYLGLVYYKQGDWEKAIEVYKKSLEISSNKQDRKYIRNIAQTYSYLGLAYYKCNDLQKALKCHKKSLNIKRELDDIYGILHSHNNIALVYYKQGKLDKAIDCHKKNLKDREKIGDKHGMGQTCYNIGLAYIDKGEWNIALEFYKKALEIYEKLGAMRDKLATLKRMGDLYYRQDKFDMAIDLFKQSEEINKELDDIHGLANTMNSLGKAYLKLDRLDETDKCYVKLLGIYQQMDDLQFDEIKTQIRKRDNAIQNLQDALNVFNKVGDEKNAKATSDIINNFK